MGIWVLDSTLREGELFRVFNNRVRLSVAESIINAGIKYLEVTLAYPPRTSFEETSSLVKFISDRGAKAVVHARATKEDVEQVLKYGTDSCAFYIAVSDLHRNYKLHGIAYEDAVERLCVSCEAARNAGFKYIRATLEDASRLFIEQGKQCIEKIGKTIELLRQHGATTVSLPDTSGIMSPDVVSEFFREITYVSSLPVAAHFHNDYGLASYNTVTAAINGASELHTTFLGVGDRNGIADTYEVVSMLEDIYHVKTDVYRERLSIAYNELSKATGLPIYWRHPLSSAARTIRAGVHQSMTVKRPDGYIPQEKIRKDFGSLEHEASPFMSHKLVLELISRHNSKIDPEKARYIAEKVASHGRQGSLSLLVDLIEKETGIKVSRNDIDALFAKEKCYILLKLKPQINAGEIVSFLNSFYFVESVDEVYGDADMVITARLSLANDFVRELREKLGGKILEAKVLICE